MSFQWQAMPCLPAVYVSACRVVLFLSVFSGFPEFIGKLNGFVFRLLRLRGIFDNRNVSLPPFCWKCQLVSFCWVRPFYHYLSVCSSLFFLNVVSEIKSREKYHWKWLILMA